jgi:hypothetical protein
MDAQHSSSSTGYNSWARTRYCRGISSSIASSLGSVVYRGKSRLCLLFRGCLDDVVEVERMLGVW